MIIAAVLMMIMPCLRAYDYKKMQRDAGKTTGVITRISTDRVMSATGRFQTMRKATVEYSVLGEPYSASINVTGTSAHEGGKMLVYYDKNSPDKVLNSPVGIKQGIIVCAMMALTGLVVCVWAKE